MLLNVRRQSGTNTVQVANDAKERIEEIKQALPAGYDLRIVRDGAEFIEASINNVEEHLIVGSILAALVVLLFLTNLRSTLISAVAIPTSIIATFGLIWFMGFTLDTLTMLALTLSVGIVIDDAIVVLENIYRFIEEKHEDQFQAAIDGTKEIGLAVLATTLSLAAIFVPVAFMGGIVGRFMKSFGLTMAFAIMVSLVVSFTLTPMLSARFLKIKHKGRGRRFVERLAGLPRRRPVLYADARVGHEPPGDRGRASPCLVLLSSVPLFMIADKNFLPNDDQSEFEIILRAPEGTSLESTEVITNRITNAIRSQTPEVSYTLVQIAGDGPKTRNLASIYVRLTPIEDRRRDQFAVMDDVRSRILPPLASGLRTAVQPVANIGGGGNQNADIQFIINGPDLAKLDTYSKQLVARVRQMKGVVDVDTSLNAGKPEVSVRVDRPKAADMGVQIARRGRSAAPAGGRRPGDDLQRGRRAVRSPPPRPARRSEHAGSRSPP